MARYRIICTNQEPVAQPNDKAHIIGVGTGETADKYSRWWSLDEVLRAMDLGNTFFTLGEQSGQVAAVEKYICGNCRRTHIRSAPDAVKDNNLDNLRDCQR